LEGEGNVSLLGYDMFGFEFIKVYRCGGYGNESEKLGWGSRPELWGLGGV
jgi:hypothetical protein